MTEMHDRQRGGRYAVIGALVFGSLVAGLLQTIILQIQDDFPALLNTSRETASWIITATILSACAFSPVSSRLGDMFGRKRVAISLLVLLSCGSVVSAVATNVWIVIFGRGIQGLAIGVIPLAMSILKDVVAPRYLGGAIALASGTLGIGSALGLPVGALINEFTGWRGIFWVCFFLGILSALWIHLAVPPDRYRSTGSFDGYGAVGLGLSVIMLLIALAQSLNWGWLSVSTLSLSGGGVVLFLFTLLHLLRTAHPIIDIRASIGARILLTNLSALLMNFSMMGAYIVFPQIMALPADAPAGLGVDRVLSGFIMMTSGVTTALATPLISALNSRLGPRFLMITGTIMVGSSLTICLVLPWGTGLILGANIALGMGFGMSFAAMPQIIMESVSRENTAAANGLNAQFRFFGTAAASAILAAVLAHWSVARGTITLPTGAGVDITMILCAATAFIATALCLSMPQAQPKISTP